MIPTATYRFQFNADFTFTDAEALLPYLTSLGVSTVYASPLFKARSGSTHSYDVTDPRQINPEIGGEEGFQSFTDALEQHGMTLLLDIVPNHMAASVENEWWLSVLENGPSSEYAHYFDIIWHQTPTQTAESKVLLPVLGGHYGTVLENGELQVELDQGAFYVRYYEQKLPLDPKTYRVILEQRFSVLKDRLGPHHEGFREYSELIELTDELPDRSETDPEQIELRRRETGRLKAELNRLCVTYPEVSEFIDENLRLINGVKGEPESFDLLDHLLSIQAFRLAYWRVASVEINYRRFFDIADLVSMRIQDEDVFLARHTRLREMIAAGDVHGLRIDHIDGLHDPEGYIERMQLFLQPARDAASPTEAETYIVVEKILSEDEHLPKEWPVAGTTGYDFLNLVNGLFIDPTAEPMLTEIYQRVTGIEANFDEIVYQQKRRVMADLFSGDVRALVQHLDRISLYDRHGRDLTQRELGQALTELTARFPVYRTYTRTFDVTDRDRQWIEQAINESTEYRPELRRAFSFIRRVLLLEFPRFLDDDQKESWLAFVMRWQQFTGPIMAKGHEDTALYIYHRLDSVNDVGGEPSEIGVSVEEFHATNQERAEDWSHTMNTTSTHDTKRSEDVRARINVITEMPGGWGERVERWRELNASRKRLVDGAPAPDGNTEYLLYQTLIGTWPLQDVDLDSFRDRIKGYLMKAGREAKVHTSWINQNSAWEEAVFTFVDAILEPGDNAFLDDFLQFQPTIAWYGALNSLSQVLLKATSPGVPDFYQGTELWDFSLVDPDNRRPVDYNLRRRLLEQLCSGAIDPVTLIKQWQDGRAKLHVIHAALTARRAHPALFADGEYIPLGTAGACSRHVCAFARRQGDESAVIIAPRLMLELGNAVGLSPGDAPIAEHVWQDTVIHLHDGAPTRWQNVLSSTQVDAQNGSIRVADALSAFPVGLLLTV